MRRISVFSSPWALETRLALRYPWVELQGRTLFGQFNNRQAIRAGTLVYAHGVCCILLEDPNRNTHLQATGYSCCMAFFGAAMPILCYIASIEDTTPYYEECLFAISGEHCWASIAHDLSYYVTQLSKVFFSVPGPRLFLEDFVRFRAITTFC